MSSKELKKAFYDAKKELEALEAELPNFEALLAENEAEETKARGAKNYHDLAAAKNRTMAAKELLEQHQHDLSTARAEVERLEAQYQQARTIDDMAQLAKEAQAHREALEAALVEANDALKPLVDKLVTHWQGLGQARTDFMRTGRKLSHAFGYAQWPITANDPKAKQQAAEQEAVFDALRARGLTLETVLTPWASSMTRNVADLHSGAKLAQPEPFNSVLWDAVQVIRKQHYDEERRRELAASSARRQQELDAQPNKSLRFCREAVYSRSRSLLGGRKVGHYRQFSTCVRTRACSFQPQ